VVKIHGENECGTGVEGSGFLYSPDRVMTNAHVVAGVETPRVITEDGEHDTEVVHYDPDLDVAVLAVEGLGLPHLAFDRTAEPRDPAAVLGYPHDGPYDVQGARIRAEQRLRSPDIYDDGTVIRSVYSVRSTIRPGNSGGPMVSLDGDVLGVVFAASMTDTSTGYVLTAEQVSRAAALGLTSTTPVSSGSCT
jgi:S1-C subfamily serine protease